MVISVQFKDKNKVFKGHSYDYLLHKEEKVPSYGNIIRMMDENYNYAYNGTRVKVVGVRNETEEDRKNPFVVRYIKTTLD